MILAAAPIEAKGQRLPRHGSQQQAVTRRRSSLTALAGIRRAHTGLRSGGEAAARAGSGSIVRG